MATITKSELEAAFARLGQLAAAEGEQIELLLLGGGVMVLVYETRASTRDVDVAILTPADRSKVRRMVKVVAIEFGWPADWLNEGAKGYLIEPTLGATLFTTTGLTVFMPAVEQLLAMKLGAWRDDVDISDAKRLLQELKVDRETAWESVSRHLQPGKELKARFAFDDLWESLNGST